MATSAPVEPCPPPTEIEKKIDELEQQSKQQVLTDAKLQLAELNKINKDVQSVEKQYSDEYEKLKVSMAQVSITRDMWDGQLNKELPKDVISGIDEIVKCADAQIDYLEGRWKAAGQKLPELQTRLNEAQVALAKEEKSYTQLKDFKSREKDLKRLMPQSAQALGDKDFHTAYVLVAKEMKAIVGEPLSPTVFNAQLRKVALRYFEASDNARKAKTAFDQATADLQKAKKDYEDAKGKRLENILKTVAEKKAELSVKVVPSSANASGGESGTKWEASPSR